MIPLRRSVLVGVAVLAIAGLTSCERAKAPRRGTLTLDRSHVRRVDARWATKRAVQGVDPREPIANILLAMTFSIGPGDSIYVPDMMGHRIIVYDPDGLPVRTIGRMGQGPGEFQHLSSVAVDHEGRLWAFEDGRLQVLELSGLCLGTATWRLPEIGVDVGLLDDDGVWIGNVREGCHALYADEEHGELRVVSKPLPLELHLRELAPHPSGIDTPYSLARSDEGDYCVLLPSITARKAASWLQGYDRHGSLVYDYDLHNGSEDFDDHVQRIRSGRSEQDAKRTWSFSTVTGPIGGHHCLVTTAPAVICRFDHKKGALFEPFEVWVSVDGDPPSRLDVIIHLESDSRGRLVLLGMRGQEYLMAQVAVS